MKDFNGIKTIIFDLGAVIIDIDFALTHQAFCKLSTMQFETVIDEFNRLAIFDTYERGNMSDDEFIQFVKKGLNLLHTSDQEIIDAWNALLLDLPFERVQLLQKLRNKYALFLLSNTSRIHIKEVNNILYKSSKVRSLEDLFEKTYYSYDMGLRKPEAEIYLQVLKEQGLEPSETLFIDDNEDNINGARALGIQTIHVQSPLTILDYLKDA